MSWFDLGKLWKHRNFRRLWLSDTVSLFGNTFTGLALPAIAVLTFKATALPIGILIAVAFIPYPLLGLFVGVWVDRWRRRRIMVAANLGRMLVLGSIPVGFLLGFLSLVQIFIVAAANGILSVFFDTAYQAYLPVLVDREDLVEGNRKLQISASGATVAGPSVAGLVYNAIGGAFTIAFDALGYLASALSLISIDKVEERRVRNLDDPPPDFFGEMKEGVGVVTGNPILSRIAGCTATSNLGTNMIQAVYLIFAYDQLHLSPAFVGFIGTVGALGFVVGVLLSGRVTARLGVGVTLAVSIASGFIALANPLALRADPFLVLASVGFFTGVLIPPYNITQVSLRQAITPDRLQGRMNATMRTIVWGTIPVGSIIGGILGESIGIVNTLYVGAIVSGIAVLWILLGPVIRIREQPRQLEETEPTTPFIPIPD